MGNAEDIERFKDLLDQTYEWPAEYTFKFIVPIDKVNMLMVMLADTEISSKPSKKGNYISITSVKIYHSADEIVAVYKKVTVIEGIISL